MQIVTMEYFNLSLSGGTIEKSTEIPNVVVDIYYEIYTPLVYSFAKLNRTL